MVALIDTLPDIAHKLDRDILPVLDTLGTVAPDLRDLLDVSRQLNVMLSAIPGLGRIRKQIEERAGAGRRISRGRGAAERTGSVRLTTPPTRLERAAWQEIWPIRADTSKKGSSVNTWRSSPIATTRATRSWPRYVSLLADAEPRR